MKRLILVLISAILLLTLTACGETPDLSAPPEPASELELCKTLLEEFQGLQGYQLYTHRDIDSYIILNSTSDCTRWQYGEDWLETSQPLPDEVFGYLCRGGERYSTEWADTTVLGISWPDDLKWGEDKYPDTWKPWLEEFQWEENEISYDSTAVEDGKKVITLRVTTPWVASQEDARLGIADAYTVAFSLDAEGKLEQVIVDATFQDERGGKVTTEHIVHTIVSTEESKAFARIEAEYARALDQIAQTEAPRALPTGTFLSNDGNVEFTWALPKQEMTLEELPAIHAKARLMTGADAKKIAETLFGDAAFFELTPDRQLSRQELQRKIAVMEQYPSQEALDRLWGSDDKDAYIQIHRESLAAYRSLLETAPEESNLQPCGWTLKEEPNQYGQWLRAIATVDGFDYSLTVNVAQYEEGRWINSLVIAPGDADPISYTPAMHARSRLCTTREPTQEDYAACLTKAQNLLDAMGMGDYRVLTDKTYVDPAYFAQDGQYEIYVMAAPAAEGYPVLFDQSGSERYGAARAHFSFNADGKLIVFNLSNPVEMGEVVTRWQGRDLEGLLERGKQWLMCLSPEDLDRHGNLLMKRLGGDFAVTARVTITGLEQGLVPTDWYGKEQSILYTPGLLFRGTVEYYDKATNAYLTGSGDPYGPREQVLMTMDTIWDDVY